MKAFLTLLFLALFLTTITAEEWFVRRVEPSLKKRDITAKATFFDGDQLNNAACYGRDGIPNYNAKPSDFIAAVSNNNMCYKCIEITNPKNKKKVIVKIVDKCAGCPKNNVDLTPTAFSKLANKDEGIIKITWKGVACPAKGRFPTSEKKKKKN